MKVWLTPVGVLVAAVMMVAVTSVAGPAPAADAAPRECNGSVRLCDRSVGDVAFATAHNAMSSATDHFRGPNQDHPIARQLEFGIRGFQIDAYPGVRRRLGVQTDRSTLVGKVTRDIPPELAKLGERLHDRLGPPTGSNRSEAFLCHVFCELGAIPMVAELRDMRRFLERHPDEVLVVVIEDHLAADRISSEFERAGLADMTLPVVAGEQLPTLGEMLDDGKRVVVMLENGDQLPMFPNGFERLLRETPYKFRAVQRLREADSCQPNRGIEDGPIFQLNHWITPANSGRAERANTIENLGRRVRRCADDRDAVPTLVAVDFAERGNLLRVVRNLNR